MREQMRNRLEMLRKELERGQVDLQRVESQRLHLQETMLRISGAIQILEELLSEEQSAEHNGQAEVDKMKITTSNSNVA